MPLGRGYPGQQCSLARALELVGERWTMLILRDCFFGVRRFSDLHQHLDIPRAVLTARLDVLVAGGVLRRERYAAGREEYVLTERGLALWPALFALMEWGAGGAPRARTLRHVGCRADLDERGRCPDCGVVAAVGDLETAPGPDVDRRRTDAVSRALRARRRLLEPIPGAPH